MSHVARESRDICECVFSLSHVTHTNESCHTYERVTSHMSHVTHMNESRHTCESVTSHIWWVMSRVCHVTHTHEWYHAYGWVMCHVWLIMSRTQLGHVRGMWHMHMRLSQYGIHVTPPFAWILYTYIYIYLCISISHRYLSEYYNICIYIYIALFAWILHICL